MNIGIKQTSSYWPPKLLNNLEQALRWDLSEDFVCNKIGMLHLSRRDKNESTIDLARKAANGILEKNEWLRDTIECLVLVTQNPDGGGLPHSSAILHHQLGLPQSCAVFDISLGCSGFVHGIAVAKGFMESQGFRNGLLVTSDPYSTIIDSDNRDTALLFGDGATATWLSDSPDFSIVACDFGIASDKHLALSLNKNKLSMKGREIFNFAVTHVPVSIECTLKKAKLTLNEVDLVLLHQGSRFIVETIAKRLGSEGKTPFLCKNYGNTVSSSIPMMLSEIDLRKYKRIVLSGFGVGLSWATCLLEKINAE